MAKVWVPFSCYSVIYKWLILVISVKTEIKGSRTLVFSRCLTGWERKERNEPNEFELPKNASFSTGNVFSLFLFQSVFSLFVAELWRAKRACGVPLVSKSTHPRKFGNHVTVHRPQPARPSVRTTGKPMFNLTLFMLWLVKIWQVSSCEKFMQHLESCLLW